MWLSIALVSVAAIGGGGFLAKWNRDRSRPGPRQLKSGTKIQVTRRSSRYYSKIISASDQVVKLDPIRATRRLPGLIPGDTVSCLVPAVGGAITFWGSVTKVDSEGRIELSNPHEFKRVNRRSEKRDSSCHGVQALVNGGDATMVNISSTGACFRTNQELPLGDRITLRIPTSPGPIDGWVLAIEEAGAYSPAGRLIRVRFERPLAGLSL